MAQHVKIVAVLFIVYHAIIVAFGIFFFLVVNGAVIAMNPKAVMVTGFATTAIAAILIIISLPGLIAGFGLLKFRSWARILAIIIGALHLLSFPIGTALGVYALWVLLSKETQPLFV